MKLFLCSNFQHLAPKFLPRLIDLNKKNNCLFVPYADEEKDFVSESSVEFLKSLNFNVYHLNKDYKFDKKIDIIYVKGGNATQLLHYLKMYNQFDKIKEMVLSGVVYSGLSAGALIAGSDTEWTLESEPYDFDMKKEFGQDALLGFNFINKLIFVHASRHRLPITAEMEMAGRRDFKLSNEFFYKAYLKERKQNQDKLFIVLKDNEALIKDDETEYMVRLDWSKYPVLDEYKLF